MAKRVDMSNFDEFGDETIEQYLNKQGCTLGDKADTLQKIMEYTAFLYIQGILTETERSNASKRFMKMFKENLYEME